MGTRIYRNTEKKIIGGVLSGLAEVTDTDVSIWRGLILFLALVFGTGCLIYVIAWIVIPTKETVIKEQVEESQKKKYTTKK